MQHSTSLTRDLRELPPIDSWAAFEPAGTATVACSCGLDTGHIPEGEAFAIDREHRAAS
ncbi:hypothetical protein ABZY10_11100 [Streptomyces sp. NPDC006539]|uniref:hypothetical protein n=1 Tax=Streptomyces sp. NPDC006539 TaxID=3155352 RepID=UPI0033AAA65B